MSIATKIVNLFFSKVVRWQPTENKKKRSDYKKAFQRLWVAGALGAFFTALVRILPLHLKEFSWAFTIESFDTVLRYGYLLWLLSYFFISNLEIDRSPEVKDWDITYDILQSVCSLTAAFFLGFVLPDHRCDLSAYLVTNVAIFIICSCSLLWFGSTDSPSVNRLRWAGVVISVPSLLLALVATFPSTFEMFGSVQTLFWIIGVILAICSFSLLFRLTASQKRKGLLKAGVVGSIVSLLLVLTNTLHTSIFIRFAGLQVLLWIILVTYARIRVDTQQTS